MYYSNMKLKNNTTFSNNIKLNSNNLKSNKVNSQEINPNLNNNSNQKPNNDYTTLPYYTPGTNPNLNNNTNQNPNNNYTTLPYYTPGTNPNLNNNPNQNSNNNYTTLPYYTPGTNPNLNNNTNQNPNFTQPNTEGLENQYNTGETPIISQNCVTKRELELMRNLYTIINSALYPFVVQVLDEYSYIGSPMYSLTGIDRESLAQLVDKVIYLSRPIIDDVDEIYLEQGYDISTLNEWNRWLILRSTIESLILNDIFSIRRPEHFKTYSPNIF